jgi:hypothetical protein
VLRGVNIRNALRPTLSDALRDVVLRDTIRDNVLRVDLRDLCLRDVLRDVVRDGLEKGGAHSLLVLRRRGMHKYRRRPALFQFKLRLDHTLRRHIYRMCSK